MIDRLKLKGMRVTKDKKQQDVARVLGISVSAYNMKENCKREFSRQEIKALFKYFELTAIELVDIFFAEKVHVKRNAKCSKSA